MGSLRKKNVTKIENTYVAQQETESSKGKKEKAWTKTSINIIYSLYSSFSIIAVATLISQNSTLHEKNAQIEKAESKLAQMKIDEKSLKAEIVKLNDDEYLAKLVRRDYFLSEEGEIIFNLPKDEEERD